MFPLLQYHWPLHIYQPLYSVYIDLYLFSEFYTPSNFAVPDSRKPDQRLQLDWVYGYRGRDARSNLYVLPSGEIMYYVASVAVIYDKKKHRQRHYMGHNEDITRYGASYHINYVHHSGVRQRANIVCQL